MRLAAAFLLALVSVAAHAQTQQSVRQSGTVTPKHGVMWTTNGVVQDAGTSASGGYSSLGVTNNGGPGICVNSGVTTGPYNALCLSAATGSAGVISLLSYGGATNQTLNFDINGTIYNIGTIAPITSIPANTVLGNNTSGSAAPSAVAVPNCSGNQALNWTPTVGFGCNPIANTSQTTDFTGDVYFKSGRPWADIRGFGAQCDNGVTDNGPPIAAAAAVLNTLGSGIIFIPPCNGVYCVTTPQTITTPSVTIMGAGGGIQGTAIIASCGVTDITPITLNGPSSRIENLTIFGGGLINPTSFGSSHPALSLGSLCVGCVLNHMYVAGGSNVLDLGAADAFVQDVYAQFGYGGAIAYVHAGMWFIRDKFDQTWPVSIPASGTNVNAAWASLTAYSTGAVVSTQGFLIQATAGGTSGGIAPTLKSYGQSITDGTVTWTLVAPFSYYGVQLDTNAVEVSMTMTDMTCACTAGVAMTNTLSGTPPSFVEISQSTVSTSISSEILLLAGNRVFITDVKAGACVLATCGGITTLTAFSGDMTVQGSELFSNQNGITIGSGTNYVISNNRIYGSTVAGVNVAAGISGFVVTNNVLGADATFGPNTRAVIVQTGASDHYIIANNLFFGASSGLTDGGTGTNKTLTGNQ